MTEFEEWYENHDVSINDWGGIAVKSMCKEAWNAALNEAKKQLPDLGGYKYASQVNHQFNKNIDRLYE